MYDNRWIEDLLSKPVVEPCLRVLEVIVRVEDVVRVPLVHPGLDHRAVVSQAIKLSHQTVEADVASEVLPLEARQVFQGQVLKVLVGRRRKRGRGRIKSGSG